MSILSYVVEETFKKCLDDVVNKDKERRLEALKHIVDLLSSDSNAKEYFYIYGGTNILIKQFTCEEHRIVAQRILFALSCSAIDHVRNQKQLQNILLLKYIYRILQHPRILKCLTLLNCSLLVISTLACQNSTGQCMAKKYGCFSAMLLVLDDILLLEKRTMNEEDMKMTCTLEILCRSIGTCMNNPLQAENQIKASQHIPKILEYLSSLNYSQEKGKKSIQACLNFLMLAISGNEHNQCYFAKCGGIRYLQLLIKHHKIFLEDGYILQLCLMTLNEVISNNRCSQEVSMQNNMPFLLGILQKDILTDKTPLILLICNLLQSDEVSLRFFKDYNGPILIQQCIKNGVESEDFEMVVKHVLKMCGEKESISEQKINDGLEGCASPMHFIIEESICSDGNTSDASHESEEHSECPNPIKANCRHFNRENEIKEWISKSRKTFEIPPTWPFNASNIDGPVVSNHSSHEEIAHKDKCSLRLHNDDNCSRIGSQKIHRQGSGLKEYEENIILHVEKVLKNSSETLASDSDVSSDHSQSLLCDVLPANSFLPGINQDQCLENERHLQLLAPSFKFKTSQAGNSSLKGHSNRTINTSPRKRPYSLANKASFNMRLQLTKLQHSPPNFSVHNKSDLQLAKKTHSKGISTNTSLAGCNCFSCKLKAKVGNLMAEDTGSVSLEPSYCDLRSKILSPITPEFFKRSQDEIFVRNNVHQSKNSQHTPTAIQREDMDLDHSTSGISVANSPSQQHGIGAQGKVSAQLIPASYEGKHVVTGSYLEHLKHESTPRPSCRFWKYPSELCKSSIQLIKLHSSASGYSKAGSKSPLACGLELFRKNLGERVLEEDVEILYVSPAMDSKPLTSGNKRSASICSESTISIYSTDTVSPSKKERTDLTINFRSSPSDQKDDKNEATDITVSSVKDCISLDDEDTEEIEIIHELSASKLSLNAVNPERLISCNEVTPPNTTDENLEREQKQMPPVNERMKKKFPNKQDSIKNIPLTPKEVENIQDGVEKFGLHFGLIRKHYSFLPERSSKELFLAWKEMLKIIGIPKEHQVNEKMLEVCSDDTLSSE
ncbi:uncharacterized protein LOC124160645 isoform X1 [Ischnura elegans]|uniref:uncharacterized protein LOC124160645 isoform X1 n=1 Tax=Ischnura elegans TaxID=197161 RepID=UPI001ED8A37D|nr:uncharacterized protein LOC124160645 isoform X1 [Ischnura elegans]XP_046392517.1 uncharacterized protein LOC124160645 isoform X1 [Ischnura elegans]